MARTGSRLAAGAAALAVLMLVTSFADAGWRRAMRRANRAGYYASSGYGHGYGGGYYGGVGYQPCGCEPAYVSGGVYAQPDQYGYQHQYQGQHYQQQPAYGYQGQIQNQPYRGQQYSAGRPTYDNVNPQPIPEPFHGQPPAVNNPGQMNQPIQNNSNQLNNNRNQQYSPPVQPGVEIQSDLPDAENQLNNNSGNVNPIPQPPIQNRVDDARVEAPREERQQNPIEEGGSILSE